MIDMSKPFVGYRRLSRQEWQVYIIEWRNGNYLAQMVGGPTITEPGARGTCEALHRLTGVQSGEQLGNDFKPMETPGWDKSGVTIGGVSYWEFAGTIADVKPGDKVSGICGGRIPVKETVPNKYGTDWGVLLEGMPLHRRVKSSDRLTILTPRVIGEE